MDRLDSIFDTDVGCVRDILNKQTQIVAGLLT